MAFAGSPDKVLPVTVDPEIRVGGARVSRRYASDGRDVDAKPPGRLRRWLARIGDFADRLGLGDRRNAIVGYM